jgi:hypothetical protein
MSERATSLPADPVGTTAVGRSTWGTAAGVAP